MHILRWIAFLPAAAIVGLLCGKLGEILGILLSHGKTWFSSLFGGLLLATCFITVGLKVAPSRHNFVKWILIVLCIIFGVMVIIGGFLSNETENALAGVGEIFIALAFIAVSAHKFLNSEKIAFTASENLKQSRDLTVREAESISREFGKFLAEKLPVIKDARLLPYPKETIMEALKISIRRIRSQPDPEASQLLNALEMCKQGLSVFADIDPDDREAVAYFNQFPSAKVVPQQRKAECIHLIIKYMERGAGTA